MSQPDENRTLQVLHNALPSLRITSGTVKHDRLWAWISTLTNDQKTAAETSWALIRSGHLQKLNRPLLALLGQESIRENADFLALLSQVPAPLLKGNLPPKPGREPPVKKPRLPRLPPTPEEIQELHRQITARMEREAIEKKRRYDASAPERALARWKRMLTIQVRDLAMGRIDAPYNPKSDTFKQALMEIKYLDLDMPLDLPAEKVAPVLGVSLPQLRKLREDGHLHETNIRGHRVGFGYVYDLHDVNRLARKRLGIFNKDQQALYEPIISTDQAPPTPVIEQETLRARLDALGRRIAFRDALADHARRHDWKTEAEAIHVPWALTVEGMEWKGHARVLLVHLVPEKPVKTKTARTRQVADLLARLREAIETAMAKRLPAWLKKLTDITQSLGLSDGARSKIILQDVLAQSYLATALLHDTPAIIKPVLDGMRKELAVHSNKLSLEWAHQALAGNGYFQQFPKARAINRQIEALVGPTNSGKTHAALERMAKANSGIYLAPLRLLALEIHERMNAQGIPCNLVTGEERIIVPGARHVAATIEAGVDDTVRDVAVIDEIQMLADYERGWAWSQAVIGTAAHQVLLVGSDVILPQLHTLVATLDQPLVVQRFERMQPLEFQEQSVGLEDARAGDAWIAFSRRDVMAYRQLLRAKGHKVACVYGALGPSARREQARRFREGEADVLVATDAIGMGLNLPIARVVFTSDRKFDGRSERELSPYEITQIAGRAGRFGLHDKGLVAVEHNVSSKFIGRAVVLGATEGMNNGKPRVRAPWNFVDALCRQYDKRLIGAISDFNQALLASKDSALLPQCDDDLIAWADRVSKLTRLPLRDQFTLLACPVSKTTTDEVVSWMHQQAQGETIMCPNSIHTDTGNWGSDHDTLEANEHASQLARVYLWLALHFPQSYPDGTLVRAMDARLQGLISKALTHRGLARHCNSCGNRLPAKHTFRECQACYEARQIRRHSRWRSSGDSGYDDEDWR